ncbi:MAG TPA: hypothetical protein VIJ15_10040, partial [Dermatophilaceae bacterium]
MPGELPYLGADVIRFADLSFRWIDVASFSLTDSTEADAVILARMISSARFADTHDGPRELWEPGSHAHGPYRLDYVSVADYEPLTADEAKAYIGEFIWQPEDTPGLTVIGSRHIAPEGKAPAEIEALVGAMIERADTVYRLRDLDQDAKHEGGDVLW